jgi:hypothetical protein
MQRHVAAWSGVCTLVLIVLMGTPRSSSSSQGQAAPPTSDLAPLAAPATREPVSTHTPSVTAGEQSTAADAAVSPTATRTPTPINIGNFVWHDLDKDGQQDPGEPGVGGVTVELWNAAKTFRYDQKQTNSSGNYSLTAPLPGSYRVRVVLPSMLDTFSPKDAAGGNDQLDSDINPSGPDLGFTDTYTFGSNLISITTIDAGLRNVQPSPTPTRTSVPTMTPTATATGLPALPGKIYMPAVTR